MAEVCVVLREETGAIQPNVSVSIWADAAGATLAMLYSDDACTMVIANPITSDLDGLLHFYARDATLWYTTALQATPLPLVTTSSSPVVNVRDYGATGDGTTNDSTAVQAAITAAATSGQRVHMPGGVYYCPTTITLADNVSLFGDGGMDAATDATFVGSWLKGRLDFGSGSVVRDIKLGDDKDKCACHNNDNASYTTFERVRFRGGGGTGIDTGVVVIGYGGSVNQYSASHLTFRDCVVECNLGIEDYTINDGNGYGFNDVSPIEVLSGSHLEHIVFDGCHIGATNGVRTGSPRAGIEYWIATAAPVDHGAWEDLIITNCIFERTDAFSLDLTGGGATAAGVAGAARRVLVSGCTFKGAGIPGGLPADQHWAYCLAIEAPFDLRVVGCAFTRGYHSSVSFSWTGETSLQQWGTVISGCTFDLLHDNGIATYGPSLNIQGHGLTVSGCTFRYAQSYALQFSAGDDGDYHIDTYGNVVANCTFYEDRTTGSVPICRFAGANCYQNLVTGCYFYNHTGGYSLFLCSLGAHDNVVSNCIIDTDLAGINVVAVAGGGLVSLNNVSTAMAKEPSAITSAFAPTADIATITAGVVTRVELSSAFVSYWTSQWFYITGSDSTPSIDGWWEATYVSSTVFTIAKTTTIGGTTGTVTQSWDNRYSMPVDLVVSGGTVTAIQISRNCRRTAQDPGDWTVTGLTSGVFTLRPGDGILISCSVSPTVMMVPH